MARFGHRRQHRTAHHGLFLLTLLLCPALAAQPVVLEQEDPQELEARLVEASGRQRLRLLADLTERYFHDRTLDRARILGLEALELLRQHPEPAIELQVTEHLCHVHHLLRKYPKETLEFARKTLDLARAAGDPGPQGRALWFIGSAHRRANEKLEAIGVLTEAAELLEQAGDALFLGRAHLGIGDTYQSIDEYAQAIESYQVAHQIFVKADDAGMIAVALADMGLTHIDLGNLDKALDYSLQALAIFEEIGPPRNASHSLGAIGEIHLLMGEHDDAADYLRRALAISQDGPVNRSAATQLMTLGDLKAEQGLPERALEHYQEALAIAEKIDSDWQIGKVLNRTAGIYLTQGRPALALAALERALASSTASGDRESLLNIYQRLKEAYLAQGRHREALEVYQKYEETKSEIFNESNSRSIALMEARFDTDQKEKEIALLEQQQTVSVLELERERNVRQALVVGFGLVFAIVLLVFNRLRLKAQAARMAEAVRQEKAVNARLREVDRLKDEFLANTSHELRTPLYGITGLAESLIDGAAGDVSAAMRANLSMIVDSGRRLGHLVNDILDFSKLRHKSLELDRRPVELRGLVSVVLTLSMPLVGSKNLRLENSVPPDLPLADADENRLQQIFYNLIGNAIKFTEEGAVEVSASTEGERLVVCVSDTGVGIPEAIQERIFDAFEQADASVERQHGGTGLGLAVTRRLVELHGGSIRVESCPGEGSKFFVTLTVAERPAASPAEHPMERTFPLASEELSPRLEQALMPPVRAGEDPANAIRILAVDDEPVNRQVLSNYLSLEHFDLVTAPSGDEALRLIRDQRFDLVLLDVMMPKVSGYEVCRVLRETHPIEELPVLFLTAKNQASDVVTGLALGANDYLTKPIARDELLARIRPHLDLLQIHHHLEELVEEKMSHIKVLEGILPICATCKKIRDNDNRWNPLESYIDDHSQAQFSHGICPDCAREYQLRQGQG